MRHSAHDDGVPLVISDQPTGRIELSLLADHALVRVTGRPTREALALAVNVIERCGARTVVDGSDADLGEEALAAFVERIDRQLIARGREARLAAPPRRDAVGDFEGVRRA